MVIGAALWMLAVAPAEPGLRVDWAAPPGCATAAEVQARVVRLVGAAAARAATLTARGTVRAEGGRWRLELELSGETGGGQRSLTAGRCEELAEAGALVIAIAVDPRAALADEGVVPAPPDAGGGDDGTGPPGQVGALSGGVDDGTGTSGQVGAGAGGVDDGTGASGQVGAGAGGVNGGTGPNGQARGRAADGGTGPDGQASGGGEPAGGSAGLDGAEVVPADAIGAKGQVVKNGKKVRVGVRIAAGVGFARILPRTGAAVSVAISAAGRGWRAEIGGLYAPPVTSSVAGRPEIGGVFQLGAVELRGCPTWSRGRFEVPVCLGLQVGAIRGQGRGSGLMVKQTAHALWAAGTLGAALAWRPRERIGLWLQVDAIVALTRPQFVTVGEEDVHRSARFGGQALAGLEFRLR